MLLRQLATRTTVASCSSRRLVHVSHIGAKPIQYPPTVTLETSSTAISITGPLGSTSIPIYPFVKFGLDTPNVLNVAVEDAEIKKQRQMWGTTRTLIANAIQGMTEGFTVPLYLVGVGYRAALEDDPRGTTDSGSGKRLNLKLGFAHTIFLPVPPYIKAEVPLPTKIILTCTDKHLLGLFAAKVRGYRKPEPYKGKVCTQLCYEPCWQVN